MLDFACIYDQHGARVYGFLAYLLRSSDEAEDLTQQTFERALRCSGGYDESRGSTARWLLTIARNLFVDHMRATADAPVVVVDTGELEGLVAAPDSHNLGLDPELARALDELTPRQRELIALRFGADLPGAEIAALTGLSVANVQQILSRSLRRIRTSLEATDFARECVGVRS